MPEASRWRTTSSLDIIARTTSGFTGADLENLLNESALLAVREGRPVITMADIEKAMIKVIAGPEKRSRVVSEHERRLTAVHEAGHAIVAANLKTHIPGASDYHHPPGPGGRHDHLSAHGGSELLQPQRDV